VFADPAYRGGNQNKLKLELRTSLEFTLQRVFADPANRSGNQYKLKLELRTRRKS
jgi:hypothetical protein